MKTDKILQRELNKKVALKTYFVEKLNNKYGTNKYGEAKDPTRLVERYIRDRKKDVSDKTSAITTST